MFCSLLCPKDRSLSTAAAALAANDNIHVENDYWVLDVTGLASNQYDVSALDYLIPSGNQNVPKFTFYLKRDSSEVYSVFLHQIYEVRSNL